MVSKGLIISGFLFISLISATGLIINFNNEGFSLLNSLTSSIIVVSILYPYMNFNAPFFSPYSLNNCSNECQ